MNMFRPTIHSTASFAKPYVKKLVNKTTARPMTILSKQSAEDYKKQNYTARMKETGRPVSPHITIYAFPVAALTSITNRVTGISLSIGAFSLSFLELVGGSGSSLELVQSIAQMGDSSAIIPTTAKFAVAFPFFYHYLAGLRHIYWDMKPDVLSTSEAETSSKIMVGASIVLTSGALLL